MDFFGKLGETLTETGKDVSQKVTDLTEITKLKMEIRSKEDSVRRQFTEIGKQYYELHKDDAEPLFEEISLINETLQKIEELRGEVAERKGKKICPSCGAPNDAEASFCNKCGAKCETVCEEDVSTEETVEDVAVNLQKEAAENEETDL